MLLQVRFEPPKTRRWAISMADDGAGLREHVGHDHVKRAQEKRKLAASIRKYAAWLDEQTKSDLLTYAASIDAEAERLERADSRNKE